MQDQEAQDERTYHYGIRLSITSHHARRVGLVNRVRTSYRNGGASAIRDGVAKGDVNMSGGDKEKRKDRGGIGYRLGVGTALLVDESESSYRSVERDVSVWSWLSSSAL